MQFHGTLDELKTLVNQLQIPCRWEHKAPTSSPSSTMESAI
jgi:hypothetical protein